MTRARSSKGGPRSIPSTRFAARYSLGAGIVAIRHLLYASPFYPLTLRGKVPADLRLAPPRIRPGDPGRGRGILNGEFMLLSHPCQLGDLPWGNVPRNPAQAAALHGFCWLDDLISLGSDDALRLARHHVKGWAEAFGRWNALPWRPDVLGTRLSAWLSAYPILVRGDSETKQVMLASMSVQARHLGRSMASMPTDGRAFDALKGLIDAAICLPGADQMLDIGLTTLGREIQRQIKPDGGHFERNPSLHLSVLEIFLEIRSLLAAAHIETPAQLQGGIDRMAPMLRAFRHGDGRLALFNGSCEDSRSAVDVILTHAEVRGKALTSAPHTGFQRLGAGKTVIIADTGKPRSGAARGTHAGTLSFELSHGRDRMIVNCGSKPGDEPGWRDAMRATAAHSTLIVDETNSLEFLDNDLPDGGRTGIGPTEVSCRRKEADGAIWLETAHNGYLPGFGLRHLRNLYLDATGEDIRGEDTLEGTGGQHFAIRFHLHPDVNASLVEGGTILLKLPGGSGWQFQSSGGDLSLDESIYLGQPDSPRRTEQIVVSGPLDGGGVRIKWRLRRIKS